MLLSPGKDRCTEWIQYRASSGWEPNEEWRSAPEGHLRRAKDRRTAILGQHFSRTSVNRGDAS
jgi:hypothetical protein